MRIITSIKKSKVLLSLTLLLMLAGGTRAQESYTLKQAIEYGLKNHRSVIIYNNEKERAKLREKEALASYLPQVNGTGTFDDNINRQTSIIPAGAFGPAPVAVKFGTQFISNAQLQLDQTIFDQAALIGIKAAKPNIQLSELGYQQNEEGLIYNIANSYYQVFVFDQYLKLLEENRNKYEQLLKITKLQADKGVIKKVDYTRIEVSLRNTLSQISQAERNLELARTRLKNVMGMDLTQDIVLADTAMLKNYNIGAEQLPAFTAANRSDYKIQQTKIQLYNLEMKRIRGTGLPKLSGYARYGVQAMGNDFEQSFKKQYNYSSVGLRLNVPVFDGFRRHSQYKMAKIDMLNAQENLFINSRTYELEYMNAVTQLNKSHSSLMNDERNLELAKETFATTSLQYQQGVASMADLLNAESAYKEAQINYVNSLLNYYLAKLDIERSNGTLKNFASSL